MIQSISPTRTGALCLAALLCSLTCGACGPNLSDAEARDKRARLKAALDDTVLTREVRDAQSRLLADVVENGALEGLNEPEIRAAIGTGQACRAPICAEQGFGPDDYYYEIGVAEGDEVKQLPVLIVGFDPRGRATRIWMLTTH